MGEMWKIPILVFMIVAPGLLNNDLRAQHVIRTPDCDCIVTDKGIELPIWFLAMRTSAPKSMIRSQLGISTLCTIRIDSNTKIRFSIKSFKYFLSRNGVKLDSGFCTSAYFDDRYRKMIDTADHNDVLTIENIEVFVTGHQINEGQYVGRNIQVQILAADDIRKKLSPQTKHLMDSIHHFPEFEKLLKAFKDVFHMGPRITFFGPSFEENESIVAIGYQYQYLNDAVAYDWSFLIDVAKNTFTIRDNVSGKILGLKEWQSIVRGIK